MQQHKAKLESHLTGKWEECGELRYTEEDGWPVTVRATLPDGTVLMYVAVEDFPTEEVIDQ